MRQLGARVPDAYFEALREEARESGVSQNRIVTRALDRELRHRLHKGFFCPVCDYSSPSPAAVCPTHGRKVR